MKLKDFLYNGRKFMQLLGLEHKKIYWILFLGAFSTAAMPFVNLVFYSAVLNNIIDKNFQMATKNIAIMLILALGLGILSRACVQVVNYLKTACFESVQRQTAKKGFDMEYEEFEKTETMDEIRRVKQGENGAGGIQEQIETILELLEECFTILFSGIFVGILFSKIKDETVSPWISYGSTAGLVVVYLIWFWVSIKGEKKFEQKSYEMRRANEHNNALLGYSLDLGTDYKNGKEIRIYGLQGMFLNLYQNVVGSISGMYLSWGKLNGSYSAALAVCVQVAAGFSYVYVAMKVVWGVITVGDVLLYAGAITSLAGAVQTIIMQYSEAAYRMEYLKTYEEFIHRPNMHYDGTLPIEKRNDAKYEFEFEDVCFQYPGTKTMVLDHVNLKLQIGKKLALVGRNGAGKSTLIKLLCRLYEPTSGRILLNGIDIKLYDYNEYVQIFSVVFQDFKMFSFALDQNIAASMTVDENQVNKALEQVGMKEKVDAMPDGMHTVLYKDTDQGVEISGGEAQKLAIARALYKDAPFVILDEPTAALDPFSEAEIYENFNQMLDCKEGKVNEESAEDERSKTAIYISHRMSSCKFCDEIVVFDQGKVAEWGTHEQLLALNGIYAALYQTQAQYYQ